MKVTLNKVQLEDITWRLEMKGVRYYDVKMEMTDHIASEVEVIMGEKKLDYNFCVDQVFSQYKLFHFSDIEERKEKKLKKQAIKSFFKELLQFFTIPKVILTALVFLIFTKAMLFFSLGTLVVFPISFCLFVSVFLIYKKFKLLGKKNYVQLQVLSHYMFFTWMFVFQFFYQSDFEHFFLLSDFSMEINYYKVYVISGLLTFFVLGVYIGYDLSIRELNRLKKQYV